MKKDTKDLSTVSPANIIIVTRQLLGSDQYRNLKQANWVYGRMLQWMYSLVKIDVLSWDPQLIPYMLLRGKIFSIKKYTD